MVRYQPKLWGGREWVHHDPWLRQAAPPALPASMLRLPYLTNSQILRRLEWTGASQCGCCTSSFSLEIILGKWNGMIWYSSSFISTAGVTGDDTSAKEFILFNFPSQILQGKSQSVHNSLLWREPGFRHSLLSSQFRWWSRITGLMMQSPSSMHSFAKFRARPGSLRGSNVSQKTRCGEGIVAPRQPWL